MKNLFDQIIQFLGIFWLKAREVWSKTVYHILNYLLPRIKTILTAVFSFIKRYFSFLNSKEKWSLLALIIVVVLVGWLWWRQNYFRNTVVASDYGGAYTEGIIGKKSSDIQQVVDKLTKVGLVRFDNDGKITGDLAESWEIKNDGRQYLLKLRGFAKGEDLISTLKDKKNWQDIEIKTPEEHGLEFDLKQPYSPFLATLSEPIFPYGPYEIEKESKTEIRLKARKDFYLGRANIEKIVLKLYPDEESLQAAFAQKEIDGLAQADSGHRGYSLYKMTMPRWQVVFFNLNRDIFKDKNTRQKISKSENLDKTLEAVLVTSDKQPYVAKAEELRAKWEPLGLKIHIVARDPLSLQKETIPKRDYDLLLYGLDYGADPDPYPFWHSSQISETGLNLAGFANVDADHILEEGRLTTDEAKRKELYDRFQAILTDETPAIFLEQTSWQYLVSNKVKGIKDHQGITPADRYGEVWKWYIKEKRVRK